MKCSASFTPLSRLKTGVLGKGKLAMFKSTFVPILTLTYGHESCVITEIMRSQMQAFEMRFLQKIKGVTMLDKPRNTAI